MEDSNREPASEISVIIPCKTIDAYVERCTGYLSAMYPEVEIIIIPDSLCPGYPAGKRNMGMRMAKGNIFAFIDSDAYPSPNWLDVALYYLDFYPAVCGPGVLPPDAPECERIADIVYQMLPYSERVTAQKPRILSEYPTFNLIVKREVATQFEDYLTGEDTLFTRKIKQGIFYHPDILVYHNRRGIFKALWRQVGTYGRHRGCLIRIALLAWVSTVFVYGINFIKGFFMRRPS